MSNRANQKQDNSSNAGGKKSEMSVIRQAAGLEVYTARAVFNFKIFPKKYRPVFTEKILDHVFDINDGIIDANELDLRIGYERTERHKSQRTALRACKKLMNRIHTAHELGIIDDDKFKHWVQLVVNVKNLLGAWAKSDEKRGFSPPKSSEGESL